MLVSYKVVSPSLQSSNISLTSSGHCTLLVSAISLLLLFYLHYSKNKTSPPYSLTFNIDSILLSSFRLGITTIIKNAIHRSNSILCCCTLSHTACQLPPHHRHEEWRSQTTHCLHTGDHLSPLRTVLLHHLH